MLSLSAKTKYGIVAIVELAENYGKGLVQIRDIVKRRKVPKNYLEQILNRLTKQGIVKSTRGNRGGYELGKDPGVLKLLDIIKLLEGEMNLEENAGLPALQVLFAAVEESINKILDISISEFMELQKKHENDVIYYI